MNAACPRTEALSRRLDGDLSVIEERELSRHVDGCAPCRAALAALGRVQRQVSEARPNPPESLAPHVMGALRREGLVGRRRSPYLTLGSQQLWTLAAGLVLAVGMTMWLGGGRPAQRRLSELIAAQDEVRHLPPAAPAPEAIAPEEEGGAKVLAATPEGEPSGLVDGTSPQPVDRPTEQPAPDFRNSLGKEKESGDPWALRAGGGKSPEADDAPVGRDDAAGLAPGGAASAPPAARERRAEPQPVLVESVAAAPAQPSPKRENADFAPAPPPPAAAEGSARSSLDLQDGLEKDQSKEQRSVATANPPVEESRASRQKSVGARSAEQSEKKADSGDSALAAWAPESGTTWDHPPRWTPSAERMIERVRGGSVALRVSFTAEGKVTAIDVVSGDRVRGAQLGRFLRALPHALHPAERAGVVVAGAGRVKVGSGG